MLQERVIPFRSGDGFQCNLIHVRGSSTPSRGPVLLVHGAGVRANIFRAPVKTTLIDSLVAQGYDVWLENWRASIDFEPNRWTLDQAALHDHPVAVRTVIEQTGVAEIKAVIHCQGSTSFMMSAVAGLIPQVTTIVSNAVSLHTVVPWLSKFKSNVSVPLVSALTPYLNPQWGIEAKGLVPKLIKTLVELTHHECENAVCKQTSFTYGTGFPTLWRHENLNAQTHDWLRHEFAHVPMSFFSQMGRCLRQGHLVAVEGYPELPANFVSHAPKTDARITFLSGELNRCFLSESQRKTFAYFESHRPGLQSLHIVPGYGHLDIFLGQYAWRDVFPVISEALNQS